MESLTNNNSLGPFTHAFLICSTYIVYIPSVVVVVCDGGVGEGDGGACAQNGCRLHSIQ